MQKTYKGMTAAQILRKATTDGDGRKFVTIRSITYTVVEHPRVELANGNIASHVVIESDHAGRYVIKF
jgi:hypothetical protein